jgi:FHS family glucose/mannose:H+ symporter-like MFS transporter
MLTAAMDLDSDNGPVLSGLANIGGSIGYQAAALGTGLAAQQVGIATAYWLIPVLAVWLLGTVSYFSYLLHKKQTEKAKG